MPKMTWGGQEAICVVSKRVKITNKQRPDPFCIAGHEIMAFAAESYVKAFGATPNVSQGVTRSFDVRSIWPTDSGDHKAHVWHSGQFRSNMPKQKDYWKALLGDQAFDITTTTLP